jgi:hypothetical protein
VVLTDIRRQFVMVAGVLAGLVEYHNSDCTSVKPIPHHFLTLILRISNKYGSLTWNKFLMKSVTTLKLHIQNTHRFRGFKLTFADWLKFSLKLVLMYEIQSKFLTNDELDLI